MKPLFLNKKGDEMRVEVTEFILPNARQEKHNVEVPDDCAVGYESLKRHGCRLTAERLMTGVISQCIEHEEGDYDMRLTTNGPAVLSALAEMIRAFDGVKFEEWLKALTSEAEE